MKNQALRIAKRSKRHAAAIGVDLEVEWQYEEKRLTFIVDRQDGAPGSGAIAIQHLLDEADGHGIPVVIDVIQSIPALIRYYWRFGFRCFSDHDDAAELAELQKIERERAEYLARPGADPHDYDVTFMWRVPGGRAPA